MSQSTPSGKEMKAVAEAIVKAFTESLELANFLALDVEHPAPGIPQDSTAPNLQAVMVVVRAAQAQGWYDDLLRELLREKKDAPSVRALAQTLTTKVTAQGAAGTSDTKTPNPAAPPPPPAAATRDGATPDRAERTARNRALLTGILDGHAAAQRALASVFFPGTTERPLLSLLVDALLSQKVVDFVEKVDDAHRRLHTERASRRDLEAVEACLLHALPAAMDLAAAVDQMKAALDARQSAVEVPFHHHLLVELVIAGANDRPMALKAGVRSPIFVAKVSLPPEAEVPRLNLDGARITKYFVAEMIAKHPVYESMNHLEREDVAGELLEMGRAPTHAETTVAGRSWRVPYYVVFDRPRDPNSREEQVIFQLACERLPQALPGLTLIRLTGTELRAAAMIIHDRLHDFTHRASKGLP